MANFARFLTTSDISYQTLTLQSYSTGYLSTQTFTHHIHLLIEINTNGLHYGADMILHPYDSSECFVCFSIYGQSTQGYAYLNSTGHVFITLPDSITPTSVTAHYYEYNL